MNCEQLHSFLDDLLLVEPDQPEPAELRDHIKGCPACAADYERARAIVASLQPRHSLSASNELKERIMSQVIDINASAVAPVKGSHRAVSSRSNTRWYRMLAVAAILIAAAAITSLLPPRLRPASNAAFGVISQAHAAEEKLFARPGIIHLMNRILVKPISDPELASGRWLPLTTMDAGGKPHFHQLKLDGKQGKEYAIVEEVWYDSATGRYAQVLRTGQDPLFAASCDGKALYFAEKAADGSTSVVRTVLEPGYRAPESPANFLGIGGNFSGISKKYESQYIDLGEQHLDDGSPVRVIEAGVDTTAGPNGPPVPQKSYVLFKVRESDSSIIEMEQVLDGQPSVIIRREKADTVDKPGIAWDLSGIAQSATGSNAAPPFAVTKDSIMLGVTVQHMVEKATFQTYVFGTTSTLVRDKAFIADIMDPVSPLARMFLLTCRSADGRHVIMVESPSYNRLLGPRIKEGGKPLYESPNGFKVHSGTWSKWLANILITSARAMVASAPSPDASGFILESPAGTYPALAINGKVTDEELHALVDGLVPAGKEAAK